MRYFTVLSSLVCCCAASIAGASEVTVHIFDFDFSTNPKGQPVLDAVINVGDTVHWVWDEGMHTTTSVAGSKEVWDSGQLMTGATFDHVFTQTGTFQYYCKIHGSDNGDGTASGMAGTVKVNPVPEPATWAVLACGVLPLALLGQRRRRSVNP